MTLLEAAGLLMFFLIFTFHPEGGILHGLLASGIVYLANLLMREGD